MPDCIVGVVGLANIYDTALAGYAVVGTAGLVVASDKVAVSKLTHFANRAWRAAIIFTTTSVFAAGSTASGVARYFWGDRDQC